jgi:hypothetical protein
MEVDSQKPKEWVGITNEPNCRFAIAHVHICVAIQRLCSHALSILPCPCPSLPHLTLPCLFYLTLPLLSFANF